MLKKFLLFNKHFKQRLERKEDMNAITRSFIQEPNNLWTGQYMVCLRARVCALFRAYVSLRGAGLNVFLVFHFRTTFFIGVPFPKHERMVTVALATEARQSFGRSSVFLCFLVQTSTNNLAYKFQCSLTHSFLLKVNKWLCTTEMHLIRSEMSTEQHDFFPAHNTGPSPTFLKTTRPLVADTHQTKNFPQATLQRKCTD